MALLINNLVSISDTVGNDILSGYSNISHPAVVLTRNFSEFSGWWLQMKLTYVGDILVFQYFVAKDEIHSILGFHSLFNSWAGLPSSISSTDVHTLLVTFLFNNASMFILFPDSSKYNWHIDAYFCGYVAELSRFCHTGISDSLGIRFLVYCYAFS